MILGGVQPPSIIYHRNAHVTAPVLSHMTVQCVTLDGDAPRSQTDAPLQESGVDCSAHTVFTHAFA